MSLALILALALPGADHAFACTASGADAKAFTLAFTEEGGKLAKIVVTDPEGVLDPLGKIMVYEYGGGGMSKHLPPRARPKYTGVAGKGGVVLTGTDKVMTIELTLEPRDSGGFAYRFHGNRRMDSTMFGEFDGEGSCVAKGPVS